MAKGKTKGSFGQRMAQRGEQVIDGANRVKRELALRIDSGVVLRTPVDTGQARAGWRVSLGAPDHGERTFIPGEKGSTGAANAQLAITQGEGVIAVAKPGQSIFVTNTVAHIVYLNEGTSAQAPAQFVQAEIMRAVDYMKNTAILPDNVTVKTGL